MSKKDLSMSSHTETHVFDPVKYIKAYYSGPENFPCQLEKETVEWALDNIYRIFDGGQYRGKTLLGIGTGPVVKDVITASQWFDEVFLSDISIDNVAFLQKWKSGDSEAIDAMKYQMIDFALREGKGTSWETKNEQVRIKVKDAILWDMNKPEMFKGTVLDGVHFDLVIACLTVSTACSTIDGYIRIISNISDMLKSGGHFVILDTMDQTSYTVDDKKFGLLCVTEDEIKKSFLQNGFEIEQFDTHNLGNCPKTISSDAENVYCVVGRKM